MLLSIGVILVIKLDSQGMCYINKSALVRKRKYLQFTNFDNVCNAEEKQPVFAIKEIQNNQNRKILRQLHIDEIPQFFNVLKGNMSLVGPRPERPNFVEEFAKTVPGYLERFKINQV